MPWLPEKFRDLLLDPFSIEFKPGLVLENILGYPHAGNDVLVCRGKHDNAPLDFVVKIARHMDANLAHEASMLPRLSTAGLAVPELIDSGTCKGIPWIALSRCGGERLSFMQDRYRKDPAGYCRAFGRSLAFIHGIELPAGAVRPRMVHSPVTDAQKLQYEYAIRTNEWLAGHDLGQVTHGFVHGDHHHANLLWEDQRPATVLDWELCGTGIQEFDLAWALCLRPGQTFFDSPEEENHILEGYRSLRSYKPEALEWFQVLVMSHFWHWGDEESYRRWIELRTQAITGR